MNAIKRLRIATGLSQDEVAKKLGIGQSTVAMWESGVNMPRADKFPELASIFNCNIADLFQVVDKSADS